MRLEERRQGEFLAKGFFSFTILHEARTIRGNLVEHSSRFAEVHRLEVEAVDHRRDLDAHRLEIIVPRLVRLEGRRPEGDVVNAAASLASHWVVGPNLHDQVRTRAARPGLQHDVAIFWLGGIRNVILDPKAHDLGQHHQRRIRPHRGNRDRAEPANRELDRHGGLVPRRATWDCG